MTSKWIYLPLTSQQKKIEEQLAVQFPECPSIARLLVLRGLKTAEEVRDFFYPSLSQLPDPFLMRDMKKAVERLNQALGAKEKVMVYGDYDVDGTTAVALVYRYLQRFYSNVVYYIPTRDDEGYGISQLVVLLLQIETQITTATIRQIAGERSVVYKPIYD
ncbi:MAG: hypothetical protein II445_03270, partial [Muribaculaceae bacterium]|nr:hypothetical protein [Muribaculaceae bacterium]